MAGLGTYGKNKILDAIFNNTSFAVATPYLSLHQSDPGATGTNEVTGGSYARQAIGSSFPAASGGAISSDVDVNFTAMPDTTANDISYVGVWDASSAGNFIWGGALVAAKVTNAGDTLSLAAGDIDASLT